MLRYDRQTKPGLVTLYDIRPGNGVGPFLQPQSPHGAFTPERSPNCAPPQHTQKQCTTRESSWGLPSLSLTTEGSRMHLGGEPSSLLSSLWCKSPI